MDFAAGGLNAAVIGAGWAGCAAAAELARAGARVTLFEATDSLGGRARRVDLELAGKTHALDNGQHLLIGAYSETARLLHELGVQIDAAIERRPFALHYPDGFRLQAARLPAPWHLASALAGARGLPLVDRAAMISMMGRLKRDDWRVTPDRPATDWLRQLRQTERAIARIWRPLALAALNTPLADASAQIFANVLHDSLGASATASQLWLPRADLSALLPDAVERSIVKSGGQVLRNSRIDSVHCTVDAVLLTSRTGGTVCQFDHVIYAGPPAYLASIAALHAGQLAECLQTIARFAYEPIATIFLKYEPHVRLRRPFFALCDDAARDRFGQWVFDRGALDPGNAGVMAVVISASGAHQSLPLTALCKAAADQLTAELRLPLPRAARAIVERRATLRAVPDLERPINQTPLARLTLAGDWTASGYPSTLETAVRSGVAAAGWVLGNHARNGAAHLRAS